MHAPVYLRSAVREFINFFSFVRICMKFNTFLAFIKLFFFQKTIITLYNVANIRLSRILHKTLSKPLFKSAYVKARV